MAMIPYRYIQVFERFFDFVSQTSERLHLFRILSKNKPRKQVGRNKSWNRAKAANILFCKDRLRFAC